MNKVMMKVLSRQTKLLVALVAFLLLFSPLGLHAKKFTDNPEELNLYNKIKELFQDEKNFETHRMSQQFLRTFTNSIRAAEINYIKAETDEHFYQSIFHLRNVTKNFPGSYWALKSQLAISLKYYALGNYHKAEREFKVFIDTYTDSKDLPKAMYFRSNCLFQIKDYERAHRTIKLLIEKYPKSTWAAKTNTDIANIHFFQKKYKEAIKIYLLASTTATSIESKSFILGQLGLSYMKIGQKKKGLEIFQTLVAKYPKSSASKKISRIYVVH